MTLFPPKHLLTARPSVSILVLLATLAGSGVAQSFAGEAGQRDPSTGTLNIRLPADAISPPVAIPRHFFMWSDLEDLRPRPPGVAVASSIAGRLDVFARAKDGALLYKRITGSSETSWESLGGDLTSDPAVVSFGPGHLDVFVRGRQGELAHLGFRGGSWQSWQSLGGTIESAPAVASWGFGRIDVFARGLGNRLVRRTFASGRWLPWEDLGGTVLSDPAVASWGFNRLDVFARGASNDLVHRSFAGTWSPWASLGGTLTSAPAAATTGRGRLHVVARGPSGVLLHRALAAGTWGAWETRGGRIESAPDAMGFSSGRVEVFARGFEDRLVQWTFSGTAWLEPRLRHVIALEPAWGVADLHAHPASHLAFGAGEDGGGILWGKPGLAFDPTGLSVTRDLPPCPADKHAGFDEDAVRHETRKQVLSTIDQLTGHPHESGADGRYTNWPHALSPSHQQMHVSFVRRAFQGGVRLMFASVTDNQTLAMLWHRRYDPGDARLPTPGPTTTTRRGASFASSGGSLRPILRGCRSSRRRAKRARQSGATSSPSCSPWRWTA